jgi:TonB family protein
MEKQQINFVFSFFLFFFVAMAFTCKAQNMKVQNEINDSNYRIVNNDTVYKISEQMPQFPGGDKELLRLISNNLKYPVIAQENGIQGKVILRFVVLKTGKVSNIEVVRSLDPSCDKEAVRVIKMLPDWVSGEQNGEKVSVYYTLPITFKLAGDNKNPFDDEKFRKSIVCVLDGVQQPIGFDFKSIKPESVTKINILKPDTEERKAKLIAKYGEKAKQGVILIETKMNKSIIVNSESFEENDEKVYQVVEQMPQFPGGEQALLNFISKNTRYPTEALKQKIQGRVILRFVVSSTGKVEKPEVIRSLDSLCDEEALRVVKSIPDFIPGKQNGEPVAVWYVLPIAFRL